MLVPRFSAVLRRDRLELRGWRLTAAGARALADEPALAAARVLDLTGNKIGDDGLAALLASPHLGRVSELRLAENGLTAAGVGMLAGSPALSELVELDLSGNGLGADAALALTPLVPRLDILKLTYDPIGDAGARALAAAGCRCEELSLSFCGVGPEGLAALLDAGALARAHALNFSGDPLGDAGAIALTRLAGVTDGFSCVDLGWTGLTASGLEALLASGLFRAGVSHLALRGNPLGEAGLRVLATHPGLPATTLHLDDGPPELVKAIRARTRAIVNTPIGADRVLACPYCYEALDLAQAICPHCRIDATNDAPTDESEQRHRAAARRPCPHCGGAMHARYASRCPHCASWAVDAETQARDGAASRA
jgi:hypothetical protein